MSTATMPTVVVVDDDEPMCKALERSLRRHGFRVRTYTSAHQYLAERDAVDAQCIVADINMPGLGGVGMRRVEREQGHDVPTVFISGQVDVRTAVGAMKEGALDLLEKPVEESVLIGTVERAIARSAALRAAERELEGVLEAFELLTPREAEVCALVASGRRNKEIAAVIGTTEKTVKVHRARVMQKLAVNSIADLVRLVDRVLGDSAPVAPTGEWPSTRQRRVLRVMTSTLAAADAPPADRAVDSRATRLTVQREAALAAKKYF